MNKVFDFSKTALINYCVVTACRDQTSILRILGLSPLQILLLKYGIKYLTKSNKHIALQFLQVKLKNGFQRVALVDFAKHMWDKWVLYNC